MKPRVSLVEIQTALAETGGNVSETARRLCLRRNSLYERLERGCMSEEVAAMREMSKPVTVPGAAYRAAQEAAFDLAYLERKDWRPEDVVRAFFAEAFEPWLEQRLEKAKG